MDRSHFSLERVGIGRQCRGAEVERASTGSNELMRIRGAHALSPRHWSPPIATPRARHLNPSGRCQLILLCPTLSCMGDPFTTHRYEVRVRGHLGETCRHAFADLRVETHGKYTVVLGALDQSALHGVLARIESLGLELVEVRRLSGTRDRANRD